MENKTVQFRGYDFLVWKSFSRELKRAKDPELQEEIFKELIENPLRGDLLKGGIRKARVGSAKKGTGKRGGYRYLFYLKTEKYFYLLGLLDKTKAENFSKEFTDALAEAVKSS